MDTDMTIKPRLKVLPDSETLAAECVNIFVQSAQDAIDEHGMFYTAVSGGHTPERFFELLGQDEHSLSLPWSKIQLFWVDERYVSPESELSNYKLARDTFLTKVQIPEENVHRINTEFDDLRDAVSDYEKHIIEVFQSEQQIPQFDLIYLGMGPDGHTGSLFPNSFAPFDTSELACVVYGIDRDVSRITLTVPVLTSAKKLAVIVSGSQKAAILKEVFSSSEPDEVRYPIHALWPILDRILWLADVDAAKELS